MGVLTDFVVADLADAQKVCDSSCPYQDFDGFAAKGINTFKLDALHAILRGEAGPPIDATVCSGGEDGPWVFEVPRDLVQRLAALTAQQLEVVARQWAATEEFSPRYDNWPLEAVQEVLNELATLCNRAVTQGKSVLMWMCL
jgi:hypothetical protein